MKVTDKNLSQFIALTETFAVIHKYMDDDDFATKIKSRLDTSKTENQSITDAMESIHQKVLTGGKLSDFDRQYFFLHKEILTEIGALNAAFVVLKTGEFPDPLLMVGQSFFRKESV